MLVFCISVTTLQTCIVFAARTYAGLTLFCPQLVPEQWLLSYQVLAPFPMGHRGDSMQFTAVSDSQRCLSTRDKYKAAEKCALALVDVISCVGMSIFRCRLCLLEDLLTKWSNNVDVRLVDAGVNSDEDGQDDKRIIVTELRKQMLRQHIRRWRCMGMFSRGRGELL